jgi:hypothetical protein
VLLARWLHAYIEVQKHGRLNLAITTPFAVKCGMQNMSTIPLGKGGLGIAHDGSTEKTRHFCQHPIDVKTNYEARKRAILANNGPTSSVGVTLGGRISASWNGCHHV